MDKTYNRLWILFSLILVFTLLGFYQSYFVLFQTIEKIPLIHHFHTLVFLLWFLLLFIQPFLIRIGNIRLHRFLGKCSYVLMPLIIISVFILTRNQYRREILVLPRNICIAHLIIPLPQLVIFTTMYILALVNVKNMGIHLRYIVDSSLVLIGPGLGRAFISLANITYENSVQFSFLMTEIILTALILYDRKKGNPYKPYLVLLVVFVFCHLGWFFIPYSDLWQWLGGAFARLFI